MSPTSFIVYTVRDWRFLWLRKRTIIRPTNPVARWKI